MSHATPPRPQAPAPAPGNGDAAAATPARRRGPPWWGVVAFLALLGGMVLVNQWATTGGPPIAWVDSDLDAALARVSDAQPRVFLYLYEQGDAAHQRNERQVFPQRWARYPLENAICVRIALGNDMPSQALRKRFNYNNQPLFLLLDRSGTPVGRADGAVDERQFSTYIGKPILRALGQSGEGDQP